MKAANEMSLDVISEQSLGELIIHESLKAFRMMVPMPFGINQICKYIQLQSQTLAKSLTRLAEAVCLAEFIKIQIHNRSRHLANYLKLLASRQPSFTVDKNSRGVAVFG